MHKRRGGYHPFEEVSASSISPTLSEHDKRFVKALTSPSMIRGVLEYSSVRGVPTTQRLSSATGIWLQRV